MAQEKEISMFAGVSMPAGKKPASRRMPISSSKMPCRQWTSLENRHRAWICSATTTPQAKASRGNRYRSPRRHWPLSRQVLSSTTLPV